MSTRPRVHQHPSDDSPILLYPSFPERLHFIVFYVSPTFSSSSIIILFISRVAQNGATAIIIIIITDCVVTMTQKNAIYFNIETDEEFS